MIASGRNLAFQSAPSSSAIRPLPRAGALPPARATLAHRRSYAGRCDASVAPAPAPGATDARRMAGEWLRMDPDAASRATIEAMVAAGDEAALWDLMCQRLEFGASPAPLTPLFRPGLSSSCGSPAGGTLWAVRSSTAKEPLLLRAARTPPPAAPIPPGRDRRAARQDGAGLQPHEHRHGAAEHAGGRRGGGGGAQGPPAHTFGPCVRHACRLPAATRNRSTWRVGTRRPHPHRLPPLAPHVGPLAPFLCSPCDRACAVTCSRSAPSCSSRAASCWVRG
jgi:hypothetical protein